MATKHKFFTTAVEAALYVMPKAMLWKLSCDELCDRDGLQYYAECLDKENPQAEDGFGYMASEDGRLGITLDGGKHVHWLAEADVSVSPEEQMTVTETPWQVIKGETMATLRSFRQMFTVKGAALKVLITGITMLVVWIGTMVWQRICASHGEPSPFVARFFAWLTFADGGVSNNVIYILGGLCGKAFVLGSVMALVLGGFKRTWRGMLGFGRSICCLRDHKAASFFLCGMGAACILYNFFTGSAALSMSMAGVAGIVSMMWAIGGGRHFIGRMTVALTAHVNPQSRIHYADTDRAVHVLSGMAAGFLLAILLSFCTIGFVPYIVGLHLIVASVMTYAIGPDLFKEAAAVATVLLALLWPASAQADDWRLELVRAENYADPNADVDFYGGFFIRTGRHSLLTSEEYKRAVEDEGYEIADGLSFTCTEPPATIAKGDVVSLQLSRNGTEHVFFAYNADSNGNSTPPFNRLQKICDFLDSDGRSEEFGGAGSRTVSYTFDDEFFVDQFNSPAEAPISTEFVICFSNGEGVGETRWIYQYHPTNAAVAVVVVDEEGNVIDSELIPPAGSGEEGGTSGGNRGSGDSPYDETGNGGMAGAIGGTVVVVVVVVVAKKKPEEEETLEERNPEYFKDIKEKHDKWVEEDRERVRKEIEARKDEHEKYKKRKEAEEKAFWHKYNRAHDLKAKYLAIDDEGDDIYKSLRRSMIQKQGEWGAESWSEQSKADYIDSYLIATKALKDSADTGMDMAAEYGGEEYKVYRDIYKAAAELTQTMTDAAVRGKSLKRAALVGTIRAGITWLQYHTEGKSYVFAAVNGEGVRDFITALDEGKSFKEAWEAANKGARRGTKDAIVDHFTGKATDASKTPGGAKHSEGMKSAYGAYADDAGKIAGDEYICN